MYIFSRSLTRGQYWICVLIGGLAAYYLFKLLMSRRKSSNTETSTAKNVSPDSSESRNKLIDELRKSCETYRKNREKLIRIAVLILITAVAGCFYKVTFGIAVSIFSLPVFYLIYRNTKAIRMIDNGLKKYT